MKKVVRIIAVFLSLLIVVQSVPLSTAMIESVTAEQEEINPLPTSENYDGTQSTILYEITDDRTENSKSFMRSDGVKVIAQYPTPVHFENEHGELTEYDNSLSLSNDDSNEDEYKTNKSDIDIRISKKTNGKKLIRVTKDNFTLSWNFSGIEKVTGENIEKTADDDKTTIENAVSEVYFSEAFENTDLQYIINGGYLKENIILNSKNSPDEFTVKYKHNGLTPVLSQDKKTVYLNNIEDEAVFIINIPFMTDADGEECRSLYYELCEVKSNQFSLTLKADREWLQDENRAYPVIIDPVIHSLRKLTDTTYSSAFIASNQPTTNYGSDITQATVGSLYVGYEAAGSTIMKKTRTLIKFALPSLKNGDRVVSAYMNTYIYACWPDITVNLHNITSSWNSNSVTWNTSPSHDSVISEYKYINDSYETGIGYISWDITRLVDSWYTGTTANNGIMLISPEENASTTSRAIFYASGYPDNTTVRPYLSIAVRNMSGYEDYYSFTSLAAGRGGNVSVNNYNGNVVITQPVTLDNGGLRMPVNISAIYNTNNNGFGVNWMEKGWQLNYNLYIKANPYINSNSSDEEKKYKYYLCDADGTEHYFYFENLNGTEGKDEDGLGYTLKVDSGSTAARYNVTDKNGNTMIFNSSGYLVSINEKGLNSIRLAYENITSNSGDSLIRLRSITDGAGRVYLFEYNSSASVVLTKITDPAGRVTRFTLSGSGLGSITYPDSKAVTFSYEANGVLSKITSPDGTSVEITYKSGTSTKMAASITEKSGSSTNDKYLFDYFQNETVVTDRRNRKITYQFNSFGQPTGIVSDADKTALGLSYAPGNTTDANANRILSSSKVQQSVQNYVTDPSFDNQNLNSYYSYEPNPDGDNTGMAIDLNYGHYRKGSFKIKRTAASGSWTDIDQHIKNIPSGTYTASAYISTNGYTVTNENGVFAVQIVTDGTVTATYRCEPVTYTAAGEWVRRSITVTISANQYIKVLAGITDSTTVGTFWVDDIQLEQGCGINGFNIVQNPSFYKGNSKWGGVATSFTTAASTLSGFPGQITFSPKSNGDGRLYQYILFDGKAGDVFSAGAWIKADSVPTELAKNLITPEKKASCKLRIELIKDSTNKKVTEKEYNPNVSSWQFVSMEIIADTDIDAIRITIVYDNNCNSISVTGAYILAEEYGQTYTYDKNGNLISSADVTSSISSYGFSGGNLSASHNPTGSGILFNYNEDNNLVTSAYSTNGQRYTYAYDSSGNPLSVTVDGLKKATNIEDGEHYYILNAASGKALDCGAQIKGQDSHMWSWGYNNAYQRWTAVENSDGTFSFRVKADPTLSLDISDASSSDGAIVQIYTVNSSTAQKFTPELQSDGSFVIKTVSSNGNCAIDGQPDDSEEVKNGTKIKQKTYDIKDGHQKWYFVPVDGVTTDEKYFEASATYTGNGNFSASSTDANNIVTTANYNQTNGQLTSEATGSQTTNYSYVANTNQISSVSSSGMTVNYQYSNDRLSKITTPTTDYTFTYDSFGRNTRIKSGDYFLSDTSYNSNGLVASQSLLNGTHTREYTYDELDRIKTEKRNNNTLTYYYGSNGELSYVTDSKTGTRTQYEYDLADRITSVKEFSGTQPYLFDLNSSLSYTYVDGKNQIDTITAKTELGENKLDIFYGSIQNGGIPDVVSMEWRNGSLSKAYFYDSLGRISKTRTKTGGSLLDVSYTYKTVSGNRTSTQVSSLATPAGTFSYAYDNRGNISSVSDGTYTTTYTYDNLNQLIREDNEKNNRTYVYEYSNGNLLSRSAYEYTAPNVTPTGVLHVYNLEYTAYTWKDLLVKFDGVSLSYNGKGQIMSFNNMSLSWSDMGLLGSAGNTTYSYDTSGRRLSKTTGSTVTNYYYAGDMLVGQKTGNNKLEFIYDSNGDYYGFEYNDVPYNYIKNLQGDVIAIADGSANILVRYEYDAWGRHLKITDTTGIRLGNINPIRYRSYYFDEETGFYYVSSRYYEPEIGRWISPEPNVYNGEFDEGAGLIGYNVYAYCANNPVNYYDPTGEFVISTLLICVAAGAIIGGTIGGIAGNAYANSKGYTGWDKSKSILTGIGIGGLTGGALGYFAAPAVVSATGVAGISITSGGISTIAAFGTSFGKLGTLIANNGQQIIDWGKTTWHGMQRMIERDVTQNMVEVWAKTGKALQQAGDKILYITKQGAVVIDKAGKVITAYTSQYFDPAMQEVVEKLFGK